MTFRAVTKQSSNFPHEKNAKGAEEVEQLPVANESLLKSNGDHLATKLEGLAKPNWDLEPRHNSQGVGMSRRWKHER